MLLKHNIAGVILAGGKASRMMYRDKPLLQVSGKSLIDHVVGRATPQVSELLVSVNHNIQDYAYLQLPLVADEAEPYRGPLVGIYSAMRWLDEPQRRGRYSHMACFPGDVPWFPGDVVSRLALTLAEAGAELALTKTGAQLQPLFSLWSLSTLPILEEAITAGLYGPKLILPQLVTVEVQFSNESLLDFKNINTPSDLSALEIQLAAAN